MLQDTRHARDVEQRSTDTGTLYRDVSTTACVEWAATYIQGQINKKKLYATESYTVFNSPCLLNLSMFSVAYDQLLEHFKNVQKKHFCE